MTEFVETINAYLKSIIDLQDNSEGSAISEQIDYYYTFLKNNKHIKRIVEIGFNAGVSAATFLASRDDIQVISFDIGMHNYVLKIKKELDKMFPGRHSLIIGDSKDVLPMINNFFNISQQPVDLLFVDGDHRDPMPLIDIQNALKWIGSQGVLIVDDICAIHGSMGVNQAVEKCLNEKKIVLLEHKLARDRGWGVFQKGPNA
jgi:predicted O-methyltransferase YrrM